MDKLVPDNKHMDDLAECMEGFHEVIDEDIKLLRDEDGDVFERYMAYSRSVNYVSSMKLLLTLFKRNFCAGHAVNHEFLLSEKAKEFKWHKINIEDNPFFINEKKKKEKEGDNGEELPTEIKEAILKMLLKISNNTYN